MFKLMFGFIFGMLFTLLTAIAAAVGTVLALDLDDSKKKPTIKTPTE